MLITQEQVEAIVKHAPEEGLRVAFLGVFRGEVVEVGCLTRGTDLDRGSGRDLALTTVAGQTDLELRSELGWLFLELLQDGGL